MIDCLQNLVGLTDKDCECYDSSAFPDFAAKNASESGYYLTDEDYGFPMLKAIFDGIDCGDPDNIFGVLEKSRNSAINGILTDLPVAIQKYFDKNLLPFNGLVGQRRTSGFLTPTKTRMGQLWQPGRNYNGRQLKDASFVVTAIWAGFNSTGTVDIDFDSNDPDFSSVTRTASTVAGVMTRTAFSEADIFEMPLWSKNTESGQCCGDCGLRYAISYDTTGLQPLSNKFTCCGSGIPWGKHIEAGGMETDDIDALLDNCGYSCNNEAKGIIVEGYLTCNGLQWLCELEQLDGWDLKSVLGRAIQFGSNVFLSNHVLDTGNIGLYNLLSQEEIFKLRSHSKKRFQENIMWLAENMPKNATGCYTCKSPYVRRNSF